MTINNTQEQIQELTQRYDKFLNNTRYEVNDITECIDDIIECVD
nr:MAG TPA: hypothetical protein [Caudoviricetes sp.]